MDFNEHALLAGKLVGNLQSLETSLRIAHRQPGGWWGPDLMSLSEGDRIPENPFTDWSALRTLCQAYNDAVEEPQRVSLDSIVDLRDALAHGRVFTSVVAGPIRLIKFSPPENGYVTVTHCVDMTEDWFAEKQAMLVESQRRVAEAAGAQKLTGPEAAP